MVKADTGRLDAYFADLTRTLQATAPEDHLRLTGEELAAAYERLRTATDAVAALTAAVEMSTVCRMHMDCLVAADMADEALATGILTLISAIQARVSPEDFRGLYTEMLAELCQLAAMQAQASIGDGFATEHLMAVGYQLEMLTLSTLGRHLPAGATFRGMPVVPTMALDILADCAARLHAVNKY